MCNSWVRINVAVVNDQAIGLLNFENTALNKFTLSISITDPGGGTYAALTATTEVNIWLTNVNDAPTFPAQTINLPQNTNGPTSQRTFGTVLNPADEDLTDALSFTIISGNNCNNGAGGTTSDVFGVSTATGNQQKSEMEANQNFMSC